MYMKEKSYEFDPCELDGSNLENEENITLDNWQPSEKKKKLIQSEWRKNSIGKDFNQEPGIDDLKKINLYIKQKYSDSQIMNFFGINAETLIAIKQHRYSPFDGIQLDTYEKIHNEIKLMNDKIKYLQNGLDYLSNILLIESKDKEHFIHFCRNTAKNQKKNKKSKDSSQKE